MLPRSCLRGVTLVEVLVAMLVFSLGLIGAAAMMATAARADHAAYLRTQVTFLAQNMADSMRANPIGVWRGDYNGSYPDSSRQDCAAGCTPQQLAVHDRQRWNSQLATFLPPGAKAEIHCALSGVPHAPAPDQILLQPPYGGNCAMTVSWAERDSLDARAAPQTLAWAFQP